MCKILIYSVLFLCCLVFSCNEKKSNNATNLVLTNHWFIAGPAIETESEMNTIRINEGILRVTVNNSPTGEIELNVPITPINISESNEGLSINLPDHSTYIEIAYRSTHLIKLQAREGNKEGTDCVHGESQPTVDIPSSPDRFITIKIPWSDFRLNGMPDGKLLDINNLCKFNFVNYNPVAGALLEITSVKLENYKL